MLVERYEGNPILKPKKIHSWEAGAVYNGCPIKKGKKFYLLYRALSLPHYHEPSKTSLVVSNIGIGVSDDGIEFHDRKYLVIPEEPWERFGCEDPRVTKLNGKYFIFYTALSDYPHTAEGIKVGLAISKNLKKIREKHLITPFNAKAMALFPEKINGKIWAILTVHTDKPPAKISLISFEKEEEIWNKAYWEEWYKNFEKNSLELVRDPGDHVEVGAPPIKTRQGFLLFFSYIRKYFTPERLFGVEALLLDLKNPLKVIARTKYPLLVPEEYYEKIGLVPNVVFPSGALVKKKKIYLYYGAADTTCCLTFIDLPMLLKRMLQKIKIPRFTRAKENPIITPSAKEWESRSTFNPGAIYLGGKVHLIYRAMSQDSTSVFGYANSKDGIHISYRHPEPIYVPREEFEKKLQPGNSGCEDPRLTKIGNRIYMLYTAFDSVNPPRVAITWIKVKDFLDKRWNWSKPVLISPPNIGDKDACIFPEKIDNKYLIIHRVGDDIDSALVNSLKFDGKTWIEEYRWIRPRKGFWDNEKVGIVSAPIKTKMGYILLYHGFSEDITYRIGAVLLDPKNPLKVISRLDEPIFEPEEPYEFGDYGEKIVFPCGAVRIKDKIYLYYGGGDKVIGVATIKIKKLLKALRTFA